MRKFILSLIVCVLTVLPLAAGGGGQQSSSQGSAPNSLAIVTAPGRLPIVTQPITLSIGIVQSSNVPDYENSYLTKFLESNTGIKLDFKFFASGNDGNTQFELMVSSNERLPDIKIGAPPNWEIYGDNGVFIDLTPYYEKYSYFYTERMKEVGIDERTVRSRTTAPSGKRYAWPGIAAEGVNAYYGMNFINTKWLDNLGLKMPATTEEFYNTMIAFRDRDPNRNGQRDEIPWISSVNIWSGQPLQFLINAFVYYPYDYQVESNLNVTDGRIWAPWTTEEYREALRYVNRLHNENIFLSTFFTLTQAEVAAIVSYQPGEDNKVGFISSGNPSFVPDTPAVYDYTYQVSLTGPGGVNYYPQTPFVSINATMFITKDCAYPEAAFRWMDYLHESEVSLAVRYGEKDVDWRYIRPEENREDSFGLPALFMEVNSLWGISQTKHWYNASGTNLVFKGDTDGRVKPLGSWNADRWSLFDNRFINDGRDFPEKAIGIAYTQAENNSINEIRTSINT